jgi:hypothetical protein
MGTVRRRIGGGVHADPEAHRAETTAGPRHFVHDQPADGRRLRLLTVIDDISKEYLATIPDTSITGRQVVPEIARSDRQARKARSDRQRQRST